VPGKGSLIGCKFNFHGRNSCFYGTPICKGKLPSLAPAAPSFAFLTMGGLPRTSNSMVSEKPVARPMQWFSRYNLRMVHTYEEVQQFACELPVDQRILLADSLWESVERGEFDATEAEVDAAWDAEIGRRVAEIKAGSAMTCSLAEVEADLRAIVGP